MSLTPQPRSFDEQLSVRYGTQLASCHWPVQLLAALIYESHHAHAKQAAEQVQFGSLFGLAKSNPSMDEVCDAARDSTPALHWPSAAVRTLSNARFEFWSLLREALRCSNELDIKDGAIVIHAVAIVLQTISATEESRRNRNDFLLRNDLLQRARRALSAKLPAPPVSVKPSNDPAPTVDLLHTFAGAASRADELDGAERRTASGQLEVSLATHRGPSYADLAENQDAAWAEIGEGGIVFAVADGVSTSYGSRFAAWTTVQATVRYLTERAVPGVDSNDALHEHLRNAAEAARYVVNECLLYALKHRDEPTWGAIRGAQPLPDGTARHFLENTLSRRMPTIGPAFASTLIAGIVTEATGNRPAKAHVIRIGDGAAEVWQASNLSVVRLFEVDHGESVISAAICPGPIGKDSLRKAQFADVDLNRDDDLFVSSDGLTRGHSKNIVDALRDELTGVMHKFKRRPALDLLKQAAAVADENAARDGDRRLFEDNLALIRIHAGGK